MAQKKEEGGDIADDPRKLKPGEPADLQQGSSMSVERNGIFKRCIYVLKIVDYGQEKMRQT
jgi:hypothetical protein